MAQGGGSSMQECLCGCGESSDHEFSTGHDARALFAALELLGYGAKGVIRELLMANGFQPGGARHHELRKTVARRYESR